MIAREDFADLVRRYSKSMYRLAVGILHNDADAQDAVGEAVLKAYEKLESLRNPNKFKPWIMQITANEARRIYHRNQRTTSSEDLEAYGAVFEDEHHELWDVIMSMDVVYREVLVLFYYDRYSVEEIAQIAQISKGTVKSRLSRGRAKLREVL